MDKILEQKQFFENMLFNNNCCTLATASIQAKPEAATIHYVADKKYSIFFNSFRQYRKYKNLTQNPYASIVITEGLNTIQMDGTITKLRGTQAKKAQEILLKKIPEDVDFLSQKDGLFFEFTPTWIRILIDDGTFPPKTHMILMD